MNKETISAFEMLRTINDPVPVKKGKPPCLYRIESWGYKMRDCSAVSSQGKIDSFFVEHTGKPFVLSPEHTIEQGDHYLDLRLNICKLDEAINSFHELAKFVEKYENVKYLIGLSWLGSVGGGYLVRRYDFRQADVSVPKKIQRHLTKVGLSKPDASPSYKEMVRNSPPVLIYVPRDEFLSKVRLYSGGLRV